jgi:hypothetical protein
MDEIVHRAFKPTPGRRKGAAATDVIWQARVKRR